MTFAVLMGDYQGHCDQDYCDASYGRYAEMFIKKEYSKNYRSKRLKRSEY